MTRKSAKIAAAVVATAVGSTALMAGFAPLAVAWTVRDKIGTLAVDRIGLQIGGAAFDPVTGRVTLHDITWSKGDLRLTARSLDLPLLSPQQAKAQPLRVSQWPASTAAPAAAPANPGIELKIPGTMPPPPAESATAGSATTSSATATPAPTSPAPAPAGGHASASDVTIVRGSTTITIKSIDLSGTSLTSADLSALLDSKSPATMEARLATINAGAIVISDVSVEKKEADNDFRASLTHLLLANVVAGKIGAASAAGATLSANTSKGGPTVKTGAIEAFGVDLTLMSHLFGAVRTDDAEPLKTVSDSLTVNDIAWSVPDTERTMTIAMVTQKGLKARPLKSDLKTLDEAAKGAEAGDDDAAKAARTKAALDDIASSFNVDAFTIDKMALATNDKTGPVKVAIAKIGLENFHDRTLAAFMVRAVGIDGPGLKLSFETLDLANIVIPMLKTPATVASSDALITDGSPTVAKADIGQLSVDADMPNEDTGPSHVKFTLAHFGSTSYQTPGHVPSQGSFALDNLGFDLPSGGNAGASALTAMGYKHVDLSASVMAAYDQKGETLALQKLLVNGAGMGAATLAVDFGNVGKGIMSANPSVAKASALAILLKRLDLRLVNAGLVEKALDWKAKQDLRTTAQERDAAIDLFAVKLPESLGNGPGIKAIGAAVAKFVADPKTIHISAASKDGLGASDLGLIGAPDELLSHLDIQAEANE